MIDYYTYIERS